MNPKLKALMDLANPVAALGNRPPDAATPRPSPNGTSIRQRRDGRYDVLSPVGGGASGSQQYVADEAEAKRLWDSGARKLTDTQFSDAGGTDAEGNDRVLTLADDGAPTEMSRESARRQGRTPLSVTPQEYAGMASQDVEDNRVLTGQLAEDVAAGDHAQATASAGLADDVAAGDRAQAQAIFGKPAPSPRPTQKPRRAPSIAVGRPEAGPALRPFEMLAGKAPVGPDGAPRPPTVDDSRQRMAGMTVDQPQPRAEPGGDPDLEAALSESRDRRLASGIGRAGAMVSDAFTGRTSTQPFDDLAQESDAPVREYGMRKASALRQQAEAKDAARNDPSSPESQRLQTAVSKALPGVYSPEELAHLTAADEEQVMKFGAMSTSLRQRAEEAKARAGEQQAGRDFDAQQAERQRAFTAGENAKNRGVDYARIRASGEKTEAGAAKGTNVPGMEISPDAAPTAQDAKAVKETLEATARLKSYVKRLRDLHTANGTEYVGENAVTMGQLVKAIDLEAKTIGKLGVINGPDAGILADIRGADPTSFVENAKGFVSGGHWDNTQKALDGLESWAGDQTAATTRTYGYQPRGGGQSAGSGDGAETRVINGKTYVNRNGRWKEKT